MNDLLFNTPEELQAALGERLKRLRLNRNLDQRSTAENDAHGFYRHLGFEASSAGFRYYFR